MNKPELFLRQQWLLSLLLGSSFYAIYHGVVHFSDWCYLSVATVVAAGVSAPLVPLNGLLLRYLGRRPHWPVAARWAGLLLGTAALVGLANVLTLPLHTMLGPGGTAPWAGAALLVAAGINSRRPGRVAGNP